MKFKASATIGLLHDTEGFKMTSSQAGAKTGANIGLVKRVATARDSFCAMLYNGPLLLSEACAVLAGEDGEARATFAGELKKQQGYLHKAIVVGYDDDDDPRIFGPRDCAKHLAGYGVRPSMIYTEDVRNTKEQARAIADVMLIEGWRRVLLVASAYHLPRAFLTMVKELEVRGATEKIEVIAVAASQTKWHEPPPGCDETRLDLLHSEFSKIEEYQQKGDVASYKAGIDYLLWWEENG